MLGDVLLIGDLHRKAARVIHDYIINDKKNKPSNHKYVVAISGESGSGKTELAHVLATRLKKDNIRAKLLHLDNYYKIAPLVRTEWRKTNGLDSIGLNEIDWKLVNKTIQDFREDRESMIPIIDIIPETVDKLITDFKKISMLIIDGLYAINAEDVDLNVFIDLTYHETKMAQLVREKEIPDEYRLQVLEREHRHVRSLLPKADLIVNKNFEVLQSKDYHLE